MCLTAMMVASLSIKAQEVTITLTPGWTWISCPTTEAMDFTTAMGDFTPMQGDIIKSQRGQSTYINGQWRGGISQFSPGYGYHYKSNRTASVTVTFITQSTPNGEDHDYVDLGLPSGILWATCNVGANSPEQNGDYFAWGETQPKESYDWSSYQYCYGSENTLIKYCSNSSYGYNGFTDNLTTLLPEDDAAAVNWGEGWRMPTKEELMELYSFTTNTWTTQNGVYGRLFTAANGNSIFLPAAGSRVGSQFNNMGNNGCYWSSTLETSNPNGARDYMFSWGTQQHSSHNRYYGMPVRAVRSGAQNDDLIGTINGMFSIDEDGHQVYFSKGNLQYIGSAATPYWKFADNQWDVLGTTTGQNSSDQNVDRDLFGWGTSGYNHGANCYQPWSTSQTSSDYYAYGNYDYNLNDSTGMADWGFNAIINGSNLPNQWRTLTNEEWSYLFDYRPTATGLRYAKASVNGVNGVILLPDDWDATDFTINNANNSNASFSSNVITDSEWNDMEQYGTIFLPAAGYRNGTSVSYVGSRGFYWSASSNDDDDANNLFFYNSSVNSWGYGNRYDGQSVRLVCPPSQNSSFVVNTIANPTEGGAVSGGGYYQYGTECTLTATANEGYVFISWTWNGKLLSTDATCTFTVFGNRNVVANFGLSSVGSYVDLGLPSGLLWSTCNVGAEVPEGYGDYFAWGETQPKDNYWWSTYQHCNNGYNRRLTKYCTDSYYGYNGFTDYLTTLLPEDDAAKVNWGEDWRMPTNEEWQELYDNTTQTHTTQNGIEGVLFTASNGNTLFMPSAGLHYDSSLDEVGGNGYYWSSSLNAGSPVYGLSKVLDMWGGAVAYWDEEEEGDRFFGMSVRAVRCKNSVINVAASSTACGSVSGGGTYSDGTSCTVTATANEGYTFVCWSENDVMVSPEATYTFMVSGNRNLVAFFYNYVSGAYQYVDLGLPSGMLWATCNVGAETPEGYGDYFAWGETDPKNTYSWSSYIYANGTSLYNLKLTKYCTRSYYGNNGFTDNLTTLLPEDDAATANWGSDWRMPTSAEWQELINNTTYTWASLNGVKGRFFNASNGNSIFLPAAGYRSGSSLNGAGRYGYYWSSSLDANSPYYAWRLYFNSNYNSRYQDYRYYGQTVRAVRAAR